MLLFCCVLFLFIKSVIGVGWVGRGGGSHFGEQNNFPSAFTEVVSLQPNV